MSRPTSGFSAPDLHRPVFLPSGVGFQPLPPDTPPPRMESRLQESLWTNAGMSSGTGEIPHLSIGQSGALIGKAPPTET